MIKIKKLAVMCLFLPVPIGCVEYPRVIGKGVYGEAAGFFWIGAIQYLNVRDN